jgi:segregation and condensation protein B
MSESQPRQLDSKALLESLLFVASEPTSVSRLAQALELTPAETEIQLRELSADFQQRGLRLQWRNSLVQLTTAPESSGAVERFLGLELTSRLSQAALEVLAIVSYLQPTTRPQIDQIRGVNSDGALRTLVNRSLVSETGRMDTPGRPILYGTTPEFLQYFGLESIEHLPPLIDEEEE